MVPRSVGEVGPPLADEAASSQGAEADLAAVDVVVLLPADAEEEAEEAEEAGPREQKSQKWR